ncbi:MAG TPA: IS5 family transposase [Roseiarcus sp.]|nr:IS5 family transposase [Roseiarcus sp.]
MAGRAPGFFDIDERLADLSAKGDDLERLAGVVDFELFRAALEAAVSRGDRSKGGRPPFDAVLMFKILLLQAMHSLSDERAEYLIKDRLSFMRFLGLSSSDAAPDANTIWTFREALKKAEAIDALFARFNDVLRSSGFLAMRGQIVDATIVAAPKQRNTIAEKQAIKEGRVPDDWRDKPAKLAQKDRDARWTVKYTKAKPREDGSLPAVDLAIPAFGYKNHVSIDRAHGLIRAWTATNAAAHDGARLEDVLDRSNTASDVWAERAKGSVKRSLMEWRTEGDTAYRSATNEAMLAARGLASRIHRNKPKGKPMPERTRIANAQKSKIRSKVEHVFAHQKGLMGLCVRTIGIARAKVKIGLANMAYNMRRLVWLQSRVVTA